MDASRDRVMILCRVLGGRLHYTADRQPCKASLQKMFVSGACHSVLNDREACSGTYKEIAVVRPEHVVPECVVRYRASCSAG